MSAIRFTEPARARLSHSDVVASQHERMLRAMVSAVAERGFAATVVADVVGRARVSRKTFYEHFDGLLACFLAAYDLCLEHLRVAMLDALDPELGVDDQLRRVLETYLGLLASEPELARTYLVESYAAGAQTAERRQRTLTEFAGLFAALHARMREEQGTQEPVLDETGYEIVIGSVIAAATMRVVTGRTASLPELAEPLHAHVLRALGRP